MVSEFKICGLSHPEREWVVCTKEFGHEGRHGNREIPMRCVLWNERRSVYSAVPVAAESANNPNG
jgi:hypothetical protein